MNEDNENLFNKALREIENDEIINNYMQKITERRIEILKKYVKEQTDERH